MSYEIEIRGTFRVEPPLASDGQKLLLDAGLGWRCSPNGSVLYLPSDEIVSDPVSALRSAVALVAQTGSEVSGEATWHGEDDATGSITIDRSEVHFESEGEDSISPEELARLLEALRGGGLAERVEALQVLSYFSVPLAECLDPIVSCLRHEARDVRLAAAETLGHYGEQAAEAIAPLIQALTDDEAWVRAAAAEALGLMGSAAASAIPSLRQLENDPNYGPSGRAREAIDRILTASGRGA